MPKSPDTACLCGSDLIAGAPAATAVSNAWLDVVARESDVSDAIPVRVEELLGSPPSRDDKLYSPLPQQRRMGAIVGGLRYPREAEGRYEIFDS